MKAIRRTLIPLLLSLLMVIGLVLAGCQSGEKETQTKDDAKQNANLQEVYEILTDIEPGPGETPVFGLPDKTRTFTGTGDGETKELSLTPPGGAAPKEVISVKVGDKEVTDYNYDANTGKLELPTAPKEGEKIEVTTGTETQTTPPAPTEPTPTEPAPTEPTPSEPTPTEPKPTAPVWTGAPETPIIPYRPPADSEDD